MNEIPDNSPSANNAADDARSYEDRAVKAYTDGELTFADLVASLAKSPATARRYIKSLRLSGTVVRQRPCRHALSRIHPRKDEALHLLATRYHDFGPKFAAEKLAELHQIKLSAETVRKWMKAAGLWTDRVAKQPRIFQLREPRHRRGELCQVDGSYHKWFEKRGEACCLLVFIDDATSELMALRFVRHETSYDYLHTLRTYVRAHGIPLALFSDRHSVFRATIEGKSGRQPTQFASACASIGVEIVCAETPQAKGRVERANRTLQDRLVKELRLNKISTMRSGNEFLKEFMVDYNRRFARQPISPVDAHRPAAGIDLNALLSYRVERRVSKSLQICFNKMIFILTDTPLARMAIGDRVDVVTRLDGEIEVLFREHSLAFTIFDKIRRITGVPETLDAKRLGAALAFGAEIQEVEPQFFQRNPHALAEFRKHFAEPMDTASVTLREAPPELRKRYGGRPRPRLPNYPILVDMNRISARVRSFEEADDEG